MLPSASSAYMLSNRKEPFRCSTNAACSQNHGRAQGTLTPLTGHGKGSAGRALGSVDTVQRVGEGMQPLGFSPGGGQGRACWAKGMAPAGVQRHQLKVARGSVCLEAGVRDVGQSGPRAVPGKDFNFLAAMELPKAFKERRCSLRLFPRGLVLEPSRPARRQGRGQGGTGRWPVDDVHAQSQPGEATRHVVSIKSGFRGLGPADFDPRGPVMCGWPPGARAGGGRRRGSSQQSIPCAPPAPPAGPALPPAGPESGALAASARQWRTGT